MASQAVQALAKAADTRSAKSGIFWAILSPNPDEPRRTFRLHRRSGNGWALLLAASREAQTVGWFFAESEDDRAAVLQALAWLGMNGRITDSPTGPVLHVGNQELVSRRYGGEKPKAPKGQ